ncbi:MAG: hypothetical protein ACC655_07560 [Rhodothermia bacterium]
MKSSLQRRGLLEQRSTAPRAVSYAESTHSTVTRIAQALRLEGMLPIAILLLVLVLLLGG